jgi:hypothetical protein
MGFPSAGQAQKRIAYDRDGLAKVSGRVAKGRVPGEGYLRGVGLEFGSLIGQIEEHPLFRRAYANAQGRTVMDVNRQRNLFLIILNHLDKLGTQDIIEFGSYRGGGLAFFGTLLQELYPHATVYGLDSFAGMPAVDMDLNLHGEGEFADTSVEDVRAYLDGLGLDNVVLVKGLVEDTFPMLSRSPLPTFGLAHIDLDLYEPIRYIQQSLWPHMASGGYVAYDDATVSTCLGATQAVEELVQSRMVHCEQIFPHFVFRCGLSW